MPRLANPKSYKNASLKEVMQKAKLVVNEEIDRSVFLSKGAHQPVPRFQLSELDLGRVVGRGGFGQIRGVSSIKLSSGGGASQKGGSNSGVSVTGGTPDEGNDGNNTVVTDEDQSKGTGSGLTSPSVHSSVGMSAITSETGTSACSREHLARIVYGTKGKNKYVAKQAGEAPSKTNRVEYLRGVIDLAMECKFLACLNHRNIVQLRGCSNHSPFSRTDFFILLDRLPESLPQRLNAWSQLDRTTKGVTGVITRGKRKVNDLLTDRLLVAYDIASAMEYLHEKNIVYRDLKPDNIGFTDDGVTQIFDFGLARELCDDDMVRGSSTHSNNKNSALYHLTALCGAIRYMAPEVGLGEPYNLKADVYSFSMLLHYFLALEPPMATFTPHMFMESVFHKGYRPVARDKWSPRLVSILSKGWSANITERPSFLYIMSEIRDTLEEINPNVLQLLPPM